MTNLRTAKGLLFTTAAAAMVSLLASSGSDAEAGYGKGRVMVRNWTNQSLRVMSNGRNLGVAPPRRTHTFYHVPPGAQSIVARTHNGQVKGTGRFVLRPGGTYLWTVRGASVTYRRILRGAGQGGVGHVSVRNYFPEPVHVYLGERYCGRAMFRGAVLCARVPAGRRMLRLKTDRWPRQTIARRPVRVRSGARRMLAMRPMGEPPPAYDVNGPPAYAPPQPVYAPPQPAYAAPAPAAYGSQPQMGTYRFINNMGETLNLVIDGQPVGSIHPGQQRLVLRAAGLHHIQAINTYGTARSDVRMELGPGQMKSLALGVPGQYAGAPAPY